MSPRSPWKIEWIAMTQINFAIATAMAFDFISWRFGQNEM